MERRQFIQKGLALGAGLVPCVGVANELLGDAMPMKAVILPTDGDFKFVKLIVDARITLEEEFSEWWITISDYDRLYAAWNCSIDERKVEFFELIDTIREEIKERINRCPATTVDIEARINAIESELEAKIVERLKDECYGIGFCHFYWGVKKQILHEDYGIDWKSPQELHPFARFD